MKYLCINCVCAYKLQLSKFSNYFKRKNFIINVVETYDSF